MSKKYLLAVEGSSHWYDREGKPDHDASLREARKLNLYSSVTTIDKDVFPNPFLERWKKEQLLIAAFENPRQPHDDLKSYADRIYEISIQKSVDAIEFGHQIHDAIEHFPQLPLDPKLHPWVEEFGKWYVGEGYETIDSEHIVLDHDLGVAGRIDRRATRKGRRMICDWKSQDVKVDEKGRKKPAFYDSWLRQLAYYDVADAKEIGLFPDLASTVSVIIDSNDPKGIYVKEWTRDEMLDAYDEFVAGAWQFYHKRDYWPVGLWDLTPTVKMP
jgi:hypothetical protein